MVDYFSDLGGDYVVGYEMNLFVVYSEKTYTVHLQYTQLNPWSVHAHMIYCQTRIYSPH